MKTALDCIPCLVRQSLEAARRVTAEPAAQEQILREVLGWAAAMDLCTPPPLLAQRIHRHLRRISGGTDPYQTVKKAHNRLAAGLMPGLRRRLAASPDPLHLALRLAIAGNAIDLGAPVDTDDKAVRAALANALEDPFAGDMEDFRRAVARGGQILYLADNAGEIFFDRLLVEQLAPARVTLAVRGAPVLNDATLTDAREAGIEAVAEVIQNGSDAPGTVLDDCSAQFQHRFATADLIIAKGQGNFETLSDICGPIYFLFKVKCPVIAEHAGFAIGTHVLTGSTVASKPPRNRKSIQKQGRS